MMRFNEIELPAKIQESLAKMKYENLTPIQEQIIPAVLEGKDILGCSQTGSGKTGAFLVPIMAKLLNDSSKKAIIVAPTRELAVQIMDNAKMILDKDISKALLIGGASIAEQLSSIKKGPRLIIGTPGRINDFLDSDRLKILDFDTLVLDEMDRMLDMGFSVQIDEIVKRIESQRQTMLFSATASKKIEKMTSKYLNNPLVVKIGDANSPSANVTQEVIRLDVENKFDTLLKKLKGETLFTLVFMRTKMGTEKITSKLSKEGVLAKAIHGDLKQTKRGRIIEEFRNKKFNVLVATDIAARGLDIHHIDTVINYDLPQCPEDYIHRIGRCSRGMEAKGCSISFCCEDDEKLLDAINSLIKTGDYADDVGFNSPKPKKPDNKRSRGRSNSKPRGRKNSRAEKVNVEASDKKEESSTIKNKISKIATKISQLMHPDDSSEILPKKKVKGYDIDGLMGERVRSMKGKKSSSYFITKTSAFERRKKMGLK